MFITQSVILNQLQQKSLLSWKKIDENYNAAVNANCLFIRDINDLPEYASLVFERYFQLKLILLFFMFGFHGYLAKKRKAFERKKNYNTPNFTEK